jgi:hypothetical protein
MGIMSPVPFTPEKEYYTVLFLQFFRGADIQERSVSDTFGTKNAGQSLEELVQLQALSLDLREAVMACLCGRESRRWTIAELVERLFSGKTWVGLAAWIGGLLKGQPPTPGPKTLACGHAAS